MELIRTFLAVAPSAGLRDGLATFCREARGAFAAPSPRWVEPANHHLTLVFLGATPVAQVHAIRAALREVVGALRPFRYAFDRLALFPDARRPRVIALLPADAAPFRSWQQALAPPLAALGFAAEARAYRPHLSLAWLRRGPPPVLPALAVPELRGEARAVVLYQSIEGRYQRLFGLPCGESRP